MSADTSAVVDVSVDSGDIAKDGSSNPVLNDELDATARPSTAGGRSITSSPSPQNQGKGMENGEGYSSPKLSAATQSVLDSLNLGGGNNNNSSAPSRLAKSPSTSALNTSAMSLGGIFLGEKSSPLSQQQLLSTNASDNVLFQSRLIQLYTDKLKVTALNIIDCIQNDLPKDHILLQLLEDKDTALFVRSRVAEVVEGSLLTLSERQVQALHADISSRDVEIHRLQSSLEEMQSQVNHMITSMSALNNINGGNVEEEHHTQFQQHADVVGATTAAGGQRTPRGASLSAPGSLTGTPNRLGRVPSDGNLNTFAAGPSSTGSVELSALRQENLELKEKNAQIVLELERTKRHFDAQAQMLSQLTTEIENRSRSAGSAIAPPMVETTERTEQQQQQQHQIEKIMHAVEQSIAEAFAASRREEEAQRVANTDNLHDNLQEAVLSAMKFELSSAMEKIQTLVSSAVSSTQRQITQLQEQATSAQDVRRQEQILESLVETQQKQFRDFKEEALIAFSVASSPVHHRSTNSDETSTRNLAAALVQDVKMETSNSLSSVHHAVEEAITRLQEKTTSFLQEQQQAVISLENQRKISLVQTEEEELHHRLFVKTVLEEIEEKKQQRGGEMEGSQQLVEADRQFIISEMNKALKDHSGQQFSAEFSKDTLEEFCASLTTRLEAAVLAASSAAENQQAEKDIDYNNNLVESIKAALTVQNSRILEQFESLLKEQDQLQQQQQIEIQEKIGEKIESSQTTVVGAVVDKAMKNMEVTYLKPLLLQAVNQENSTSSQDQERLSLDLERQFKATLEESVLPHLLAIKEDAKRGDEVSAQSAERDSLLEKILHGLSELVHENSEKMMKDHDEKLRGAVRSLVESFSQQLKHHKTEEDQCLVDQAAEAEKRQQRQSELLSSRFEEHSKEIARVFAERFDSLTHNMLEERKTESEADNCSTTELLSQIHGLREALSSEIESSKVSFITSLQHHFEAQEAQQTTRLETCHRKLLEEVSRGSEATARSAVVQSTSATTRSLKQAVVTSILAPMGESITTSHMQTVAALDNHLEAHQAVMKKMIHEELSVAQESSLLGEKKLIGSFSETVQSDITQIVEASTTSLKELITFAVAEATQQINANMHSSDQAKAAELKQSLIDDVSTAVSSSAVVATKELMNELSQSKKMEEANAAAVSTEQHLAAQEQQILTLQASLAEVLQEKNVAVGHADALQATISSHIQNYDLVRQEAIDLQAELHLLIGAIFQATTTTASLDNATKHAEDNVTPPRPTSRGGAPASASKNSNSVDRSSGSSPLAVEQQEMTAETAIQLLNKQRSLSLQLSMERDELRSQLEKAETLVQSVRQEMDIREKAIDLKSKTLAVLEEEKKGLQDTVDNLSAEKVHLKEKNNANLELLCGRTCQIVSNLLGTLQNRFNLDSSEDGVADFFKGRRENDLPAVATALQQFESISRLSLERILNKLQEAVDSKQTHLNSLIASQQQQFQVLFDSLAETAKRTKEAADREIALHDKDNALAKDQLIEAMESVKREKLALEDEMSIVKKKHNEELSARDREIEALGDQIKHLNLRLSERETVNAQLHDRCSTKEGEINRLSKLIAVQQATLARGGVNSSSSAGAAPQETPVNRSLSQGVATTVVVEPEEITVDGSLSLTHQQPPAESSANAVPSRPRLNSGSLARGASSTNINDISSVRQSPAPSRPHSSSSTATGRFSLPDQPPLSIPSTPSNKQQQQRNFGSQLGWNAGIKSGQSVVQQQHSLSTTVFKDGTKSGVLPPSGPSSTQLFGTDL